MLRAPAMAVVVLLLFVSPSISEGQVRVFDSGPDYASFAAAVAPRLAEVAAEFERARPRGETPHFPSDVEDFLHRTEDQVLATLDPMELAPLRDSIRLRFRRIRQKLASQARSAGFAFASFQPLQPSEITHALLDEAYAVLQRLFTLSSESRFSLRLCVVSRPDAGATFRMRPPEYREGVKSGKTSYDFGEVALGRYFYKVEPRKKKIQPIVCGWEGGGEDDPCLDLWDSSGDQLFDCDFDEGSCELRDLPPGGCSAR